MKNRLTPRKIVIRTLAVTFIMFGFTIGAVPADALGIGVNTGTGVNAGPVGVNTGTGVGVNTNTRAGVNADMRANGNIQQDQTNSNVDVTSDPSVVNTPPLRSDIRTKMRSDMDARQKVQVLHGTGADVNGTVNGTVNSTTGVVGGAAAGVLNNNAGVSTNTNSTVRY